MEVYEVCVYMVDRSHFVSIEDGCCARKDILLILSMRDLKECYDVKVFRISAVERLYVLQKAAIDPLQSGYKATFMQRCSKIQEAREYLATGRRTSKAQDKLGQGYRVWRPFV